MAEVEFKINGVTHKISGAYGPDVSLNEYIRSVLDLRGTKAMCQEGGCGACVVAVAARDAGERRVMAVNSCLVSVLSCHGWEVTTVEGLGNRTDGYHAIQQRLANFNGTQCGYCTPGWVMNMYSLYEAKKGKLTTTEIENSFAGNLCRCTGYRPIADAFKTFATDADQRLLDKVCDLEDLGMFKACGVKCSYGNCKHKAEKKTDALVGKLNFNKTLPEQDEKEDWCVLEKSDNKMIEIDCGTHKWFKAFSLADVFKAMGDGSDYKLIAGNTGQGVYHVTDYPQRVIDISNVQEIKGHSIDVNLILGGGMALSDMMELFKKLSEENEDFSYLKQFYDHMDLVAHIPVRNIGTIAGNLCLKHSHNEFQSDLFLLLETVRAMITVANGEHRQKTISMMDFLNTDMRGVIIVNVMLPPLSHCCAVRTYKIMPRSQNSHAAVNAGFLFKFNQQTNLIERASIVFGSIYPKFNHAVKTEAALVGKDLYTDATLQLALKTLSEELDPEEAPPEPSAEYRKMLAIALFYKAILYLCPDDRLDKRYRSGGDALKRVTSQGTQSFDTDKSVWPLTQPIPKIEALVQCAGESVFANDMKTDVNEVFAAFVTADVPTGSVIEGFDATEALKLPGVVAFYSAKDIPGKNSFMPTKVPLVSEDEEILCSSKVLFFGQPAGIIVASRDKIAIKAATLVKIKYASISKKKPLIYIDDVLNSPERESRVTIDATIKPEEEGHDVNCVVYGDYKVESQYHYTMETQTCVTRHTEDGLEVYAATQWLDACNIAIAECLKIPVNSINVIVRRVGGGYGGKISRAAQVACASALAARLQGRTCRFVLPLMTNMKCIGKRCSASYKFEAGVNKEGEIQYLKNWFYQDLGASKNEAINQMTIHHFYSCYDRKRWFVEAGSAFTDTPSTTWCRAPGSAEGIAMIEYAMERIAYNLKLDPMEVRLKNMAKENNPLPDIIDQLKRDSDYEDRMEKVKTFNENNRWRKRAMKILPMTYNLFYFGNFNSLISIYHRDGTITITHGGVEMGQGMNTKVAQVCAYMLGAPLEKISIKPTSSFTSPNAMVTGGSVGSESVSYATIKACEILLKRMEPFKSKVTKLSWEEMVEKMYLAGIDLQASYMYSMNDGLKGYDIYAAAILEIEVDILTGNHDVRRVDIVEDTGKSLSPEIDIGQIEGAFVMGLGYWTSEKLVYDRSSGELLTTRTWNYKPPGLKDIPADMRIHFRRNSSNPSGVLNSKATGEPALCLAVVVTHALREAVRAARLEAGYDNQWVDIPNPCTMENIFLAVGHKIEHFKLK
ncbi:unnamed protein product [Plutella xylostella]|uniref:Indole-3-acetaldehyde oxidase n=1 Tax=Plutella xylostella TaxID=51655 RepID=A0A8S4F6X5_PLUXY|nr:unnamed protein product [Plutella xylostella]